MMRCIGHIFRGPNQFRIWNERDPDSLELTAIKMYLGTYEQWRTIWLDGRPHPPDYMPHTWMGARRWLASMMLLSVMPMSG